MRKNLFCCFGDFSKAFDTVWKAGLWQKLLNNCIDGKCFRIIRNVYSKIKSCITQRNEFSDFFACEVGVKQCENLSSFLFSLYLNDLEIFLNDNNVQSLNLIDNFCIENITTYLRILILLCADDVLLISESANGLQNAINAFSLYYKQWKLKVSTNKTKIMVFSKRKFGIDSFFLFDNTKLEECEDISYLGITLDYNGSFIKAKNKLVQQEQKVLYSI